VARIFERSNLSLLRKKIGNSAELSVPSVMKQTGKASRERASHSSVGGRDLPRETRCGQLAQLRAGLRGYANPAVCHTAHAHQCRIASRLPAPTVYYSVTIGYQLEAFTRKYCKRKKTVTSNISTHAWSSK